MKKKSILVGIGGLLTAIGAGNATLKIDNKIHYFSNGILSGIGLSIIAHQLTESKRKKCKH